MRQLILDLWDIRGYEGFNEIEMWNRVQSAIPDEIIGVRPVNRDGRPLTPKRIENKISYSHHFET